MSVLKLDSISKSFGNRKVLQNFSMEAKPGEFIAIQGPSGCGKSTLLNIIGLLEPKDSGSMEHFGKKSPKPFSRQARRILHDEIGYLFQNFALLENKTVNYNLMMAMDKTHGLASHQQIQDVLKQLGLENFQYKKVAECSGGEQQRIAMARLLLKKCSLILADEPTANLDEENRQVIAQLLLRLKSEGKTIIMVTHDPHMASIADRIIPLGSHSI